LLGSLLIHLSVRCAIFKVVIDRCVDQTSELAFGIKSEDRDNKADGPEDNDNQPYALEGGFESLNERVGAGSNDRWRNTLRTITASAKAITLIT
jgi:hypothetical protein